MKATKRNGRAEEREKKICGAAVIGVYGFRTVIEDLAQSSTVAPAAI
jgi:hypothetical protein